MKGVNIGQWRSRSTANGNERAQGSDVRQQESSAVAAVGLSGLRADENRVRVLDIAGVRLEYTRYSRHGIYNSQLLLGFLLKRVLCNSLERLLDINRLLC